VLVYYGILALVGMSVRKFAPILQQNHMLMAGALATRTSLNCLIAVKFKLFGFLSF
jgi:hypothetical protein